MHDITDDFFKWIAIKPQIQQTTHNRGCEYNIRRPDFTTCLKPVLWQYLTLRTYANLYINRRKTWYSISYVHFNVNYYFDLKVGIRSA